MKPESKLPGSALAMSAERLWEVVHSHKDLNLPAHKVRPATPMPLPSLSPASLSPPSLCLSPRLPC